MLRPNLYIVAGPNGSGKSSLGPIIISQLESNVTFFNGDLHNSALQDKYPNLLSGDLQDKLLNAYDEIEEKTLSSKSSFALETNYADPWLANELVIPQKFKKRGYNIILLFLDTVNLKDSIDRVKFRVQNGLHDVELKHLKQNFKNSAINFSNSYTKFNQSYILINDLTYNNRPPLLGYSFDQETNHRNFFSSKELILKRFGDKLL